MIDAYEIGIKLALENGVSEGIAVIRRDLTALDAAIAKSAAGLVNLQTLANSLNSYSLPVARPPASHPVPRTPVPDEATAAAGPALPASVAFEAQPPQPPTPELTSPSAPIPPAPAKPTSDIISPASHTTIAVVPSLAPIPGHALERPVPPAAPEPAPAAPEAPPAQLAPSQPAARPPEPPASRAPPIRTTQPAPTPETATIAQWVPSRPPPQAEPRHAAPPPATVSATPRSPLPLPTRTFPAAPHVAIDVPEVPQHPAAPIAVPPARRHARTREAIAEQRSAEPGRRQAETQQPTSGHIYLEGAVLGRWLADELARAATRPRAGMTAFDPRVSPTWPGAPTGD